MSTPDVAQALATTAHEGQVDKSGNAYIEHPRRVAERAGIIAPAELRDSAVSAAWLHDVVEDTEVTLDDLRAAGFAEGVVRAVDLVTKKPGQVVEDYFSAIRVDPVARVVKTADLIDNTDPRRVGHLDAEARERLGAKYARAWALLSGA